MEKDKLKRKSNSQPKIDQYIPSIELKKIPPEKALTLLKKEGYQIDNEQSEEIMEFI